MRILHVNKFFYVHGGVDRYFFELSALLERNGHQVIPFSMHHPCNAASPYAGFFVSHVDLRERLRLSGLPRYVGAVGRILYSIEARRKVEALITATRPDLVHAHHVYHQLSPSILPAIKRHGLPVVLTLHDYKLICPNYSLLAHGQVCERCQGRYFYHTILERCVRDSLWPSVVCSVEMYLHRLSRIYEKHVDTFIAPSRFLRDKFIEFGFDERQIVHLPYAINVENYTPSFEFDNYFLYVGRLEAIKGVDTLIEAVAGSSRLRPYTLRIAGTGRQRAHLERHCAARGLANVRFEGFLAGQELAQMVRRAMFVVVPSVWYENSPLVVYEAFAYGKPVIASRLGGLPELVQDGETGLLFTPGDAGELRSKIEYRAERPALITRMGRAARQRVETLYSPAQHYRQLMEIYRSLRGKHPAAGRE